MSAPFRFEGGKLVRRDPAELETAPYVEAFMRLLDPLDLYLNAAGMALMHRAALLALGNPETAWVEIAVRETEGIKHILLVPTTDENPRKEPLAQPNNGSGAWVHSADDVMTAGGIATRPGISYRMTLFLAEDPDLGWVVAGNFTAAQMEPKDEWEPGAEAAAGEMDEEPR